MRQKHETATSFNQLKEVTQAIMLKKKAQENATHQESEPTQEANNANAKAHTPEPTQKIGLKPKAMLQTKKGRLNPTKKAFSERQKTAFRDNSQASANLSRGTKGSHNANAFKTGLATHQEKGGSNEA
ncbi:hypothetical protein [Helicobacter pylori]|uniref:hypothetical protein n=1 Tax=Helicobacter pylori TaxID=210 RepID=UPI00026A55B6|nr:hypothetical protein [Helicobacter pylori]EJB49471.1 putative Hac prophage II protein [Helicobacter pylori Hp A-20]